MDEPAQPSAPSGAPPPAPPGAPPGGMEPDPAVLAELKKLLEALPPIYREAAKQFLAGPASPPSPPSAPPDAPAAYDDAKQAAIRRVMPRPPPKE